MQVEDRAEAEPDQPSTGNKITIHFQWSSLGDHKITGYPYMHCFA